MSYIGREPAIGNYQVCDALTASATATYALAVGGSSVSPESANHMIVSLNGVIQKPVGSFTVSGSNIVFNSALTSSDSIDFIILLGSTLDVGIPSDASITNAKLASDLISGETDIGADLVDADLILVDDGAGGTLRKSALSRMKTYIGGGGKVLQVVSAIKTDTQSLNATSWTDISGLTADITPSATTSKVLVLAHITTSSGNHGHTRCVRGSTVIGAGVAASSRGAVSGYANSNGNSANVQAFAYLDSPSTTSATTYHFELESNNGAQSYINRTANDTDAIYGSRGSSTIILMEIGA